MSDAVATINQGVAKYADANAFASLAKSSDFLPRFQLYGSNSNACKEGKIGIGHYGLASGDNIVDCGKEVRCYVLSWRAKAMRIMQDKIETNFNPNHPEFKKIQQESGIKDTGSLCGIEFLLWIPANDTFATFYMASKTMKREAGNVEKFIPKGEPAKPLTLKSHLIKKGTYAWHGPVVTGCSLEVALPDPTKLAEEMVKFNNPPEPKDEAASEAETAATSRAR